jgi:hypothetical protein
MVSKRNAYATQEELDKASDILGFEDSHPKHRSLPANPDAGSLAPLDSTKDGKWERAISAAALTTLTEIAENIEGTMRETVMSVARARIKIGKLLNQARDLFPGDKEFGQWRKVMVPDIAPRTCSTYMSIAREFKDAPALVEAMGWSTAREMLSAPPEVKEQVKAAVEAGNVPTREEVVVAKQSRAQQNWSSGPIDSELPARSTGTDKPKPPPPEQIVPATKRKESLDMRLSDTLRKFTTDRVKDALDGSRFPELDDYSKSAIIFGFGPEICDSSPNLGVWLAVYDHCRNEAKDDEECLRIIDQAYTKMKECWK